MEATLEGVRDAVSEFLKSLTASTVMRVTRVLGNRHSESDLNGTSTCTAQRWLGKLRWILNRNRKVYVDGHEREDVVEYREKVLVVERQEKSHRRCMGERLVGVAESLLWVANWKQFSAKKYWLSWLILAFTPPT